MDFSIILLPIAVAFVGVLAVSAGAWVSARSALRVRIIDMLQIDNQDHRKFHAEVVMAINELYRTSAHLLQKRQDIAHVARLAGTGMATLRTPEEVPEEDVRVIQATEEWRRVIAVSHTIASMETGNAMHRADRQRMELVNALNAAATAPDLPTALDAFPEAEKIWKDFREHFVVQVYRSLNNEKVRGDARVYQIASIRRLRRATRALYKDSDQTADKGSKKLDQVEATYSIRESEARGVH